VKANKSEFIFQLILASGLLIFSILMLYPFLNIFAKSLSTGSAIIGTPVYLWPIKPTLMNYKAIFISSDLFRGLGISVARTGIGTVFHLIVVAAASYACSKRYLKGRRVIVIFLLIPSYFNSGLLPQYILFSKLHLFNSFWVYVFPQMFNLFDFLVMMTFFAQIPESLIESAKIDGASDLKIFYSIVIPVSKPVIAAITLFCAVGQWNSYFDAVVYVNKHSLQPLQAIMQQIIQSSSANLSMIRAAQYGSGAASTTLTTQSITMATLCFTIFPIVMIYPFLQKYFIKGIMLGGVKG
jgi:putative aldouronate transport system permease protein